MTPTLKAHISLFVAQVIYALNYSIAKDVMPLHVKPLGLVFLRILGACILFWVASLFVKKEAVEKAVKFADESPLPDESELFTDVYA